MGYEEGKGLGRGEDGIIEPIKIVKSPAQHNVHERKLVFILSDSMLKGIDAERISSTNYEVKRFSHGGCTLKCIYKHLPDIIKEKPDFLILHIGTNDCTTRTSDEVKRDIEHLKVHIQKALPSVKTFISLPTIRTDNRKANTIIGNLNIKLLKSNYFLLDNTNIDERHLGRKGLHLNAHGTKQMARNIISLIKRL